MLNRRWLLTVAVLGAALWVAGSAAAQTRSPKLTYVMPQNFDPPDQVFGSLTGTISVLGADFFNGGFDIKADILAPGGSYDVTALLLRVTGYSNFGEQFIRSVSSHPELYDPWPVADLGDGFFRLGPAPGPGPLAVFAPINEHFDPGFPDPEEVNTSFANIHADLEGFDSEADLEAFRAATFRFSILGFRFRPAVVPEPGMAASACALVTVLLAFGGLRRRLR